MDERVGHVIPSHCKEVKLGRPAKYEVSGAEHLFLKWESKATTIMVKTSLLSSRQRPNLCHDEGRGSSI